MQASLKPEDGSATVEAERADGWHSVYDGTAKHLDPESVKVTVVNEGVKTEEAGVTTSSVTRELTEDEYKLEYSTSDHTSAGEIIVSINGNGNYKGTFEQKYTIDKRPLTVDTVTAEDKLYDANPYVIIKAVTPNYANLASGDKESEVVVDESKIQGIVESPNIGKYSKIQFADAPLSGDKGPNYCIDVEGEYPLSETIEITATGAPTLKVEGGEGFYDASPNFTDRFLHTVKASAATGVIDPDSYIYFCQSDEKPEIGNTEVWTVKAKLKPVQDKRG